jgi:putative ABC transport system ATP-binding protein
VTHEPRFASWADRIILLRDGRIVDETPAIAAATR